METSELLLSIDIAESCPESGTPGHDIKYVREARRKTGVFCEC